MKNRFYAFLTHLALSALVAIVTLIMVFEVWYPRPLDIVVGVTEIFLILLAVDLVIGPMLTFIVYRPGKPGLKMDLTIIAVLQLAALTYGMVTVFAGRPAFIVFNQDRFDVTRLVDIDAKSAKTAEQANNESAKPSWLRPRWVGAVAPADRKRAEEILFMAIDTGVDWPQLPELYVPLTQVKERMLQKSMPLSALRQRDSENQLADFDEQHVRWLPLHSKLHDMTVLIDSETAEVIKIVNINPWNQ